MSDYGKIFQEKKEKLNEFLLDNEKGDKQGGVDWLKTRRNKAGGSEIHYFVDGKIDEFVNAKINGVEKNFYMILGSVFERINREFISQVLDCETFECNLVNGISENDEIIQVYSPDGIGIVNGRKLREYGVDSEDPLICLFEYKCPVTRIPRKDFSLTKKYLYQVLAGLDTVKVAEIGLYCDCVIRVCSYEQIITRDTNYIGICNQSGNFYNLLGYGAIFLYDKTYNGNGILDISTLSESEMGKLLEGRKTYSNVYIDNAKNSLVNLMNEVEDVIDAGKVQAILFYKIFDFEILPVKRSNGFIERYRKDIHSAVNRVSEILSKK